RHSQTDRLAEADLDEADERSNNTLANPPSPSATTDLAQTSPTSPPGLVSVPHSSSFASRLASRAKSKSPALPLSITINTPSTPSSSSSASLSASSSASNHLTLDTAATASHTHSSSLSFLRTHGGTHESDLVSVSQHLNERPGASASPSL